MLGYADTALELTPQCLRGKRLFGTSSKTATWAILSIRGRWTQRHSYTTSPGIWLRWRYLTATLWLQPAGESRLPCIQGGADT